MNDRVEFTSLCSVWADSYDRIWLSRLADLKNGKLDIPIIDEELPKFSEIGIDYITLTALLVMVQLEFGSGVHHRGIPMQRRTSLHQIFSTAFTPQDLYKSSTLQRLNSLASYCWKESQSINMNVILSLHMRMHLEYMKVYFVRLRNLSLKIKSV